jgi:hypothetical protein
MAFFKHRFKWRGIISRVVNVPAIAFKMVLGPILEEILAVHGVIHL